MSTATSFTDPVYLDEPAGSDHQPGGDAEVPVDLNDPALLEAEVAFDDAKDPYELPPPVVDGLYRVKAKQLFKEIDGVLRSFTIKTGKKGPYAFTALELTVQDPGGLYDGRKVTDNFVSTMQAQNGGVPVVHILARCLGVKIPQGVKIAPLMDMFQKALAGEPDLVVELAWEGNLDQADQERFKAANVKVPRVLGMHRFPDSKTSAGQKSPDITVETSLGKVAMRARPRVMGYYPTSHPVGKK